ncbi:MAG: hypothetical protein RI967_1892 [Planctomycetota bacterium]|jgi:hypothetical protein
MSVPVAIVGMHRSGTSLVAGLLAKAGVPLGDELLGANIHNPHGHHEDTAFLALHDRLLAANGTDWTLAGAPADLEIPEALRDEAARIVARRAGAARGAAWGWKDPRTTVFLPLWEELLPDLRVVVVFRRAATVAASLRRRRDPPLVHRFRGAWPLARLGLPMTRDGAILAMWRTYNLLALEAGERLGERLAFVDADRLPESWPALVAWLGDAGVPLAEIDPAESLDPSLLRRRAPIDLEFRASRGRYRAMEAVLRASAIA